MQNSTDTADCKTAQKNHELDKNNVTLLLSINRNIIHIQRFVVQLSIILYRLSQVCSPSVIFGNVFEFIIMAMSLSKVNMLTCVGNCKQITK